MLVPLLCWAVLSAGKEGPGLADDFHVKLSIAPKAAGGGWGADSGSFVVRLSPSHAPLGAERFRQLVAAKFYDGAPFFRVITGFMAQFGIAASPEASRTWQSRNLEDENAPGANRIGARGGSPWSTNGPGTISFAHGGKDTRTTQCFVNFGDNGRLDAEGFAVIGRVLDFHEHGADSVAAMIYAVGESPPGGNGVEQGRLWQEGGLHYLLKSFPRLSYIRVAELVPDPFAPEAPVVAGMAGATGVAGEGVAGEESAAAAADSPGAFGRKQGAVDAIEDQAIDPADLAFEAKNDKFLATH